MDYIIDNPDVFKIVEYTFSEIENKYDDNFHVSEFLEVMSHEIKDEFDNLGVSLRRLGGTTCYIDSMDGFVSDYRKYCPSTSYEREWIVNNDQLEHSGYFLFDDLVSEKNFDYKLKEIVEMFNGVNDLFDIEDGYTKEIKNDIATLWNNEISDSFDNRYLLNTLRSLKSINTARNYFIDMQNNQLELFEQFCESNGYQLY